VLSKLLQCLQPAEKLEDRKPGCSRKHRLDKVVRIPPAG
jgi:hypothetical protein